ncbi:MAG: hypothetical protein NC124_17125, partial [Clostridium sp.]|nr:hypothetical protein [Clostridium sp.]
FFTIPILTYGIYRVNRKAVPIWESFVPMLCQLIKSINYLIDKLARIVQIRKRISVEEKMIKFS